MNTLLLLCMPLEVEADSAVVDSAVAVGSAADSVVVDSAAATSTLHLAHSNLLRIGGSQTGKCRSNKSYRTHTSTVRLAHKSLWFHHKYKTRLSRIRHKSCRTRVCGTLHLAHSNLLRIESNSLSLVLWGRSLDPDTVREPRRKERETRCK